MVQLILNIVFTHNTGMIAYFDGDCPDGWMEFSDLEGRFALAAGLYIGDTEDERTEIARYRNGEIGGEIEHSQTISEMASHKHMTALAGVGSRVEDLGSTVQTLDAISGVTYTDFTRTYTSIEGNGDAANK